MDITTERFVLVELDTGDQEYFDTPYEAFSFAKQQEAKRRGSVEYVAIGLFYGDDDDEVEGIVYRGQLLRHMIRTLDNTRGWLTSVSEALNDQEDEED